jgi:hypothetical protein
MNSFISYMHKYDGWQVGNEKKKTEFKGSVKET